MLPRKIFESLHVVMAILVLFEYFSRKIRLYFLNLILSASRNMIHYFCSRIFDHACLKPLKILQIRSMRNIGGGTAYENPNAYYIKLDISKLQDLYYVETAKIVCNYIHIPAHTSHFLS